MNAFKKYAPWYDLLYADKPYADESAFVDEQLHIHGAKPGKLLELGSGTGIHAVEFARKGWSVQGVDLSDDMVELAHTRASQEGMTASLSFRQGDVREAGAERDVDAVVSLFHVASYQESVGDLAAMANTAWRALKPGGVFLFDYWHGPAVLTQGVQTRVKEISTPAIRVTRIARSNHDERLQRVDVHYTIFFEDLEKASIARVDEVHRMRYWHPFEVRHVLTAAGFEFNGDYAWLTKDTPSSEVWAAYCVAKKPE